jgi:CRP-like cAMP-binding protein
MNKKELINVFLSTNLFSHTIANEIADRFSSKLISKNQFQLTEGKVCNEYLFLAKGCLRAFVYDTEGKEVTTNFYVPGDRVFEVSSFFNRTKSKENIQALTDCEGWYISYLQLNDLFHALPAFREFGRSVLVHGFAALKNRMLAMITETAEERYALLLKTNPEIFQHAPLKHIASYLGITDSSLSRIRKELSKK